MTKKSAEISALFSGINRHETEALQLLIKKGRKRAAVLYLMGLRRFLNAATGVAGDGAAMTAEGLLSRIGNDTAGGSFSELLAQLVQARLVKPLPAPAGRLRFYLPLVDRVAVRQAG